MSRREKAERTIYAIHQLHKPDAFARCATCRVQYPCPTGALIRCHVEGGAE